LLVLLTAGCSSSQPPASPAEPGSGLGWVTGVLGLELSDAVSSPAARAAASDLAVVIRTQQVGGVTWRRLVAADGSSGWTPHAFTSVRAVRVRPDVSPFFLLSKSPDDADFSEADEIRIDDGVEGQIVGASQRGRVAGNEELMLPEKYRRSLPWLELRFGSRQGFAPMDWIALLAAPVPQVRTLEEGLDALGARGLVWRPFLGSLTSDAAATRVTPGTSYAMDDPASAPTRTRAAVEWSRLEFVSRDEGGLMAVYGDGARRLFRFIQAGQPPIDITLATDFARPVQARHIDLNADGKREWLVEIAARYGDGFYAVLWIVDGRSTAESLMFQHLSLSQTTGESSSTNVDASWTLRDDGTIQVVRETAGTKRTTVYRYDGRLVEAR